MANAKCRTCDQTVAAAAACCSSCSTDITAKALNPCYGGVRKKISQRQPERRLSLPVFDVNYSCALPQQLRY